MSLLQSIRELIRESIRNFVEADSTAHFDQRISHRITPLNDLDIPEKPVINRKLEALKSIDFRKVSQKTGAKKFAIFIGQLTVPQTQTNYTVYDEFQHRYYYEMVDNHGKSCIGDQVWAIAGTGSSNTLNNLISVVLQRSSRSQDIQKMKYYMDVDMVVKNLDKLIATNQTAA